MIEIHKKCSCCEIFKSVSEFYKDKRAKGGLQSECKKCHQEYCKKAHQKYIKTEKGKVARKRANKKYQESRDGKIVRKRIDEKYYSTINGYLRHIYHSLKSRCNSPRNKRYNCYGNRGIKCLFTVNEFVDYVINVLKIDPRGLQIHRIDNDWHYEKGNIEFLTSKEHGLRHRKEKENGHNSMS